MSLHRDEGAPEIREKSPRYWKTGRKLSAKRIAENERAEEVSKWLEEQLAKVKAEIGAKEKNDRHL
jgi:hypothetical protein